MTVPYEVYGPIVTTTDVEDAVTSTISTWIDSYLAAVESTHGRSIPTLARPNSYNASYDYDNWPEGQLPGIAVVCPGTVEDLEYSGDGTVSAWFEVNVDVIVTDQTERLTRGIAALYQSAITLLITQQLEQKDLVTRVRAISTLLELPDVDNRTLAVGNVSFHVMVDSIVDTSAGPIAVPVPPESDPGVGPTVTSTNVTVDAEPITETLPD